MVVVVDGTDVKPVNPGKPSSAKRLLLWNFFPFQASKAPLFALQCDIMRKKLPETVTTADFAGLADITPRQCQRLVAAGILTQTAYGTFHLKTAFQAFIKHKSKREQNTSAYGKARTEVMEERAASARLARLEKEGVLVPAADVLEFITPFVTLCKTHMLRVPTKSAPKVFRLPTIGAVAAVLTEDIREAM